MATTDKETAAEKENAELKAELAKLKAEKAAAPKSARNTNPANDEDGPAVYLDRESVEATRLQKLKDKNADKRAELKAKAQKDGSGASLYITNAPFYRKGALYPAGSVVGLPEGEDPSLSWKPYEGEVGERVKYGTQPGDVPDREPREDVDSRGRPISRRENYYGKATYVEDDDGREVESPPDGAPGGKPVVSPEGAGERSPEELKAMGADTAGQAKAGPTKSDTTAKTWSKGSADTSHPDKKRTSDKDI